ARLRRYRFLADGGDHHHPSPALPSLRHRRHPLLRDDMTARLIDGKAFAAGLRERVAGVASQFSSLQGRAPGLAVVLVGEHPPSAAYVRSKAKATREAGMESFQHKLAVDVSQGQVMGLADELN